MPNGYRFTQNWLNPLETIDPQTGMALVSDSGGKGVSRKGCQILYQLMQQHPDRPYFKPGIYPCRLAGEEVEVIIPFFLQRTRGGGGLILNNDNKILAQLYLEKNKIEYQVGPVGNFSVLKIGKEKKDRAEQAELKALHKATFKTLAASNLDDDPYVKEEEKSQKRLYNLIAHHPKIRTFTSKNAWYYADGTDIIQLEKDKFIQRGRSGKLYIGERQLGVTNKSEVFKLVGEIELDHKRHRASQRLYAKGEQLILKKRKQKHKQKESHQKNQTTQSDSYNKNALELEVKSNQIIDNKRQHQYAMVMTEQGPAAVLKRALGDSLNDLCGPLVAKIHDPKLYNKQAQFNLTEDDKFLFAIGLMKELEVIHQKGFVHCDLKPANVMYDIKTKKVTIIDLGSLTRKNEATKSVEATKLYYPPELAKYYLTMREGDKFVVQPSFDIMNAAGVIETFQQKNLAAPLKSRLEKITIAKAKGLLTDKNQHIILAENSFNFGPSNLKNKLVEMANLDPAKRKDTARELVNHFSNSYAEFNPTQYGLPALAVSLEKIIAALAQEIQYYANLHTHTAKANESTVPGNKAKELIKMKIELNEILKKCNEVPSKKNRELDHQYKERCCIYYKSLCAGSVSVFERAEKNEELNRHRSLFKVFYKKQTLPRSMKRLQEIEKVLWHHASDYYSEHLKKLQIKKIERPDVPVDKGKQPEQPKPHDRRHHHRV